MKKVFRIFAMLLALLSTKTIMAQSLTADGVSHQIDYTGAYVDYTIPSTTYDFVEFYLNGGDGGRVKGTFGGMARGGEGADVTVSFDVGTSAGQLKPGGVIRVIVGEEGKSKSDASSQGGGGGGGTAILYKDPGVASNCGTIPSLDLSDAGTCWVLLAVSGGGGGGYNSDTNHNRKGKGGNDLTNGREGRGSGSGGKAGGTNGSAGEGSDNADGGGGYLTGFFAGLVEGSEGGDILFGCCDGGFGYGGGGGAVYSGAGGGGFSGGGAGQLKWGGGGGGSFANDGANSSNLVRGGETKTPNNGKIIYSFQYSGIVQAICQDVTVELDASGEVTLNASQADGGSFTLDGSTLNPGRIFEMPNVLTSVTSMDFTCNDIGDIPLAFAVFGPDIGLDWCLFTLTIEDNIDPVAQCQDISVTLDPVTGSASITVDDIEAGASDNCGVATRSLDKNIFDCNDVGDVTVTLTATDDDASYTSCTATVTVLDGKDPTVSCNNKTVQLDDAGNGSITAEDINNGSSDQCGIELMILSQYDFDCTEVGEHSVTLTVTDVNGNASTCSGTVTVVDGFAPFTNCKNATVELDASGNGSITSGDIDNGSSDQCGIGSMTLSQYDFDCTEVGEQSVTLTATDVNGNASTCSGTVTVVDGFAPFTNCKNATVELDASGNGSITAEDIDNGSSDQCGIGSMTLSQYDFDCMEVGEQSVTLTVTDVNGNTATCNATVTVEDNIAPTLICKNKTIMLPDGDEYTLFPIFAEHDVLLTDYDACGIDYPVIHSWTLDCDDVGEFVQTITWTDNNGNTSTCSGTVTVVDGFAPFTNCKNATVELDASGNGSIGLDDIDDGSWDLCGIDSRVLSQTEFGCSDIGTQPVTLTVTDVNGNTATCNATVTVEDNIAPAITCENTTVVLSWNDLGGAEGEYTNAEVLSSSYDACGISPTITNVTFLNCNHVGSFTQTVTVTDNNGNSNTCSATLTVVENTAPVANCSNATVQLDDAGNGSLTAEDINNGSSDQCGIESMTLSQYDFDCMEVGEQSVTLTVTDVNGNTATCNATVTVEDNIAPTLICKNKTIMLPDGDEYTLFPIFAEHDVLLTDYDACGIDYPVINSWTLDCDDVGEFVQTITWSDNNGNTSTCSGTVTVVDGFAPFTNCKNATVELDASGNGSIGLDDIDDGSWDLCGIDSRVLSQTDFVCSDIGTQTVTLTVTDVNGNASSCNAMIIVEDYIKPVPNCKTTTVELGADGNYTLTESDVFDGGTDNCGTVNFVNMLPSIVSCDDIGAPVSVTVTANDGNGNEATCVTYIMAIDVNNPQWVSGCPDNFDIYTDQFTCLALVEQAAPEANDGCLDVIRHRVRLIDPVTLANIGPWQGGWTTGDLSMQLPIGTYKVRWRAQDLSGNRRHCNQFITVKEVLLCPYVQLEDGVGCEDGSNGWYDAEAETFWLESENCLNPISSASDEYAFIQRELCGNGSITVKITSLASSQASNGWAGIMMRESNDPLAPSVNLTTNKSSNHRKNVRAVYGANVTSLQSSAFNRHWLRIVRNGNNFRGYASSNGTSWFLKFSHTVVMPSCIEVGMTLNSYTSSGDHTASFEEVTFEGNVSSLQQSGNQGELQVNNNERTFAAYPSPTTGITTVSMNGYFDQKGTLDVVNTFGQILMTRQLGLIESSKYDLDLSSLPSGMYTIRLQLETGKFELVQIVKQ